MNFLRRAIYRKGPTRPDFMDFSPDDTVVVALGGNAIELKDPDTGKTIDAFHCETVKKAVHAVLDACGDAKIVFVHGNGPQYGAVEAEWFEEQREFTSAQVIEETQRRIGALIIEAVASYYEERGESARDVFVHNTRVIVDAEDPAFKNPQKPVGPETKIDYSEASAAFYDEINLLKPGQSWVHAEMQKGGKLKYIKNDFDGQTLRMREVVASPKPQSIADIQSIRAALDENIIVVAGGGGGVPATREAGKVVDLEDVKAVIDKDSTAATIRAKALIILTAADGYQLDFASPDAETVETMPTWFAEICARNPKLAGSMGPKLMALVNAVRNGAETAVVTSIDAFRDGDRSKMTKVEASKTGAAIESLKARFSDWVKSKMPFLPAPSFLGTSA